MMLPIKENCLTFGDMLPQYGIEKIIIHHVGDPPRDVSAEEIHEWHRERGWAGIGYHYVIRRTGASNAVVRKHTWGRTLRGIIRAVSASVSPAIWRS